MMAARTNGTGEADSPHSGNRFRGRRTRAFGMRTKLLYLAPLPLFFAALGALMSGDALRMLADISAFAALMLGAKLLGDGVRAEAAYDARSVARPPAVPRKLFAAILAGAGVGVAAFFGWGKGLDAAILFAGATTGLQLLAFGLDPMRRKGMDGAEGFDAERVARAVDRAEALLAETLAAAEGIGDRRLQGRVERLASAARDMFRAVEDDPRDLNAARKYLTVYLSGARDATIKFAALHRRTPDAGARRDYEALLTDLEHSFDAKRQTLLLDERSDLDVEIEVLRDRLKQEGLRAGQ